MKCTQVVLLLLALCHSAITISSASSCDAAIERRCNFVCDCWKCSDERDCGYHRDSPAWGVPFSCDFEHDDCGWKDISTTSYRWVRDRRNAPQWTSRPHGDHTLGNRWGWFMVAEGRGRKSKVSARLQSPFLRDAAATCEIHIHYLMWSSDPSQINGSLSVQLVDNTQTLTLWESLQTGDMSWRRTVIYTGRISGNFQVIITASHKAHSWVDIAVDDVEFRNCAIPGIESPANVQGQCTVGQYHCGRGSCVDESALCDGTDDCGDRSDESSCSSYHSCNFDSDFCGWQSTWNRVNEFSSNPGRDHTTNKRSGHFLLAGNTTSILSSPQLQGDSNEPCFLVFYYLLDNSRNSSLVVKDSESIVLKKTGQRGSVWLREKLFFNHPNQNFSITIEGNVGTEFGTVALDDVILSPGCLIQGNSSRLSGPSYTQQKTTEINVEEPCIPVPAMFDFKKGTEGWTDISIGHLNWGNFSGGNSGSYLAVQKAEGNLKTNAEIHSPLLCAVFPLCTLNITYYLNGGPAEAVTCNFDNGLCGWYQDLTEEIDWKLGSLSDHTTGQGGYMYVEGESRNDQGDRARLISYPQSSSSEKTCLSFHYRMLGPDAGTLNLFSKYDGGEMKLIWTKSGTHGNWWHRDSVTITSKNYQLILEAVRDGSVGNIGIDDITVTLGACAAPTRCSFEAGTCDFSSEGTYKWKLHVNSRLESHTGPYHDHTLQSITGHYMVIDTSSTSLPLKKTAVLTSSKYSALSDESCLSFWYQLGGTDPGTLIVYIEKENANKKDRTQLVSISGTHQDSWHHQSLVLQSGEPWVLLFEAVGAGGDHSYIALDDIHINHHRCHEAVSCNFEHGSCAWTNNHIPLMDTYDWDWTHGAALNRPSLAPEKDHSPGTPQGHYAFVDTGAMHTEGASAWLISEHLPATTGSCFSFWYRVDSPGHFHLGELVLYVVSTQGLLPVWVLKGFHGNDWQEQQLQLNSTVEFQIAFEASKGSRPHNALVSVDDLKYTMDTLCNTQPKQKETKDKSGTIWAIVLGVIIFLLFVLLAFLVYRRWRRNRDNAPALPDQSDPIDGFDNVTYDQFQNEDGVSTSSDR
ncbi:apical endosomal glycoprotein [Gastrophryne carolinensis]